LIYLISVTLKAGFSIQLKPWSRSLNIFRDLVRRNLVVIGLAAALAFSCCAAFALNSERTIAQYVHTVWGIDKGYIGGTVYAIAQSADGYIWLATERGLVRFDGFEFTLIEPQLLGRRPIGAVRGLIEDADGSLWIRLNGPRLLRYRQGVFEDAVSKFDLSDVAFTAMSRDYVGNLLIWGPQKKALRFRNDMFRQLFPGDRCEGIVISLLETEGGALWLGTRDAGLYRFENKEMTQIVSEGSLRSVNALAPSEHGGIWIGSEAGLHLWEHGAEIRLKLPARLQKAQVFALVRDHNHNLWVGTDVGLYRIDPERRVVTGVYRSADDTGISSIYEDSEGDIWFAGSHSIERLRDGMFTSISSRETGLKEIGGSLFVDKSGRTWFGPASGGLFCLENGTVKRVAVPGLNNDVIYSIDGSGDELWLGRQQGGLTELERRGKAWMSRTFTQRDGLAQNSVYTVTRTRDGSVWAGTISGGVSILRHGNFKTYTVNNGLSSNAIFSSMEAADKKMWFASPSGLVCFDGEHWMTYSAANTEQVLNVKTVFQDSSNVLWVGTSRGLARFDHNQIELLRNAPRVLSAEVLGIGQDTQGSLWVVTDQHVLQIDRTKLLSGTLENDDVLSYGADDGLTETEAVRRDRSLVSDSSGRIWLSLPHSLAVADMTETEGYHQPVRVRVDSLSPEGVSPEPGRDLNLPSGTRSIAFRYAGTDMSTPQRTRFRYRLDGLDQTWTDDRSLRQVVYTHLSPGAYTFRIMASNALGIWNGPESDVTFNVRPAFWQTWYFGVLAVLMAWGLVMMLYRIRLIQVTGKLNRRFQDRLAERARIAQDLHDTLLQGVISVLMQLDVAQDHLPEDSPARPALARVLQSMRQVTEEGRDALRGLRTIDSSVSLETAFQRITNELLVSEATKTLVYDQGHPRTLKKAVFDEVYRIGREAYINAVAHAGATRIEITVEYGLRGLRLLINDNGCGIDARILKNGREGHWGLTGMRERAEAIGSILTINTHTPGGTSVELRVPAAIAYSLASSRRIRWPWRSRRHHSAYEKERQQSR
jgi:ligand-binding sensor domain-containing protein/signal transduction histidine kinase